MDRIFLQNSIFLPQVSEFLKEGRSVTLRARGYSMRPFIEHDRDDLIFSYAENIKVGDVVLAEIMPGHFVCHRVEKINGDKVTLRGDGNIRGTESCTLGDVRGKLVQVVRFGKTWNLDSSRFWKIYSRVWPSLLPIRRWLLALNKIIFLHELPHRLHIIGRIKNKIRNK